MKIRKLFAFALLFFCGVAQAQMMSLPMDTAVRKGKLDNGLTYYIRYNNWPEHRANFYIAQRVGSIQEDESQRGLAHFLEHMAFNGSDNFKGDALLRYCESIGVEFGGDLNAYTSIDRTVYNIDNVPTMRQQSLDSCLLILRDWSCGLTLDPKEIDKERGVIHEEWRLRTSANSRMFERNLPALYPGSKYGVRYPIGLMSVVDNFKPKELVDYYHKWYHPSNQAIIVVGDVDVNHVEAEIKKLFGGIKNPEKEAPVLDEPVPDNADPIVVVDKDKEARYPMVELFSKSDAFPDSLKNTPIYYINNYCNAAITTMLTNRLSEMTKKPGCPFVNAGASYGIYLFSKTKEALDLNAVPKDEHQVEASVKALYEELRRASEFGFTATEYKRFQNDYLAALDKAYSNKDKRTTSTFSQECISNFLDKEPITDIELYYQLMKQIVPSISVDVINEGMKESINDSNLVVVNFNVEKEGITYPTKESLLNAIKEARAAQLTAYVDNVRNEPLIKQEPKAGKIVKEEKNDKFGYTKLTLSNGVTVTMKKTDYKKDQVMVMGYGGAGETIYDPKTEGPNLKLFDEAIGKSGLGNFSFTELWKALSGVIANANLTMGRKYMSIDGSSTPKDLRSLFQLIYLYMTDIKKDEDSWKSFISEKETEIKNRETNPDIAFSDSLTATLYGHNPYLEPVTKADLAAASYDRILAMAKERTANAQGWNFTFVGNFDEDSLRQFACTYLASLPSQKKNVSTKHDLTLQKGDINNIFKRKMETPKSIGIIVWSNSDMPYTTEHSIQADMIGQILTMEMLKTIREDSSAAYSCGAQGSAGVNPDNLKAGETAIMAYCPMKPEKADVALRIMNEEVPELANNIDADKLDKVRKLMLKQADDNAKTNRYWMNILYSWQLYGFDDYTNYKQLIEKQTPETLKAFMKEFLKPGNRIEVVMLPQE